MRGFTPCNFSPADGKNFSWLDYYVQTPIREQTSASCSPYSIIAAIELAHQIHSGECVVLSDQYLIDIGSRYGSRYVEKAQDGSIHREFANHFQAIPWALKKGHHVYRNRPDFDPFELDHKGNPKIMGHVVVAIGWEYSNGKLSFLIQNSYGKSWGHGGYGFIHESCLDLNWTLIPTVKEGYKVYATSFNDIPEVSITTDWIYHTSAPQF
ncbi:ananain-like [Coffea arabica]|uniref:Ananain-like n=1 Tax=Coffea arabica TaxID=13443 RepID=A0A6P6X8S8_COFAR|nr:cathepsin B-like cysteine proteinase 1 [Coffea arabica]